MMLLKGLPLVHLISHELVAHVKGHLEQIVLLYCNIFVCPLDLTQSSLNYVVLELLNHLLFAKFLLLYLFQSCLNVIRNYVNFFFLHLHVFISRSFSMVYWQ